MTARRRHGLAKVGHGAGQPPINASPGVESEGWEGQGEQSECVASFILMFYFID